MVSFVDPNTLSRPGLPRLRYNDQCDGPSKARETLSTVKTERNRMFLPTLNQSILVRE
jgi:hypothetical protein